jgi:hypothetical protein
MEEEDNYDEDQRNMTANPSDLTPINAGQLAKATPKTGSKVKIG